MAYSKVTRDIKQELITAIQQKDFETIMTLTLADNDKNLLSLPLDEEGKTALHFAAEQEGSYLFSYLFNSSGTNVNELSSKGESLLLYSYKKENQAVSDWLINEGANLAIINSDEVSLLKFRNSANFQTFINAVRLGDLSVVQAFIDKNPTWMNIPLNDEGNFALHLAVKSNQHGIATYLLRSGAEVNQRSLKKQTALMLAIDSSQSQFFDLLISNKAQLILDGPPDNKVLHFIENYIQIKTKPLIEAIKFDDEQAFLKNLPLVDLSMPLERSGQTLIHVCVEENRYSLIENLLTQESSLLESRTFDGLTPLHLAIKKREEKMASFLLKKGADLKKIFPNADAILTSLKKNECDSKMLIALMNYFDFTEQDFMALIHFEDKDIVLALISQQHHKMPESVLIKALFALAESGNLDALKAILNKSPNLINCVDPSGQTLFHISLAKNHKEIVHYLADNGANLSFEKDPEFKELSERFRQFFFDKIQVLKNTIEKERLTEMERFINQNKNWLTCPLDSDENTALHLAVQAEKAGSVNQLINLGADLSFKNRAAIPQRPDEIQTPNNQNFVQIKKDRFIRAIKDKNQPQIHTIKTMVKINKSWLSLPLDTEGKTALHHAAQLENKEAALTLSEFFLAEGANINSLTTKKWTPLHFAIRNEELVNFFIEKKALLTIKNSDNKRADELCEDNSLKTYRKVLIEAIESDDAATVMSFFNKNLNWFGMPLNQDGLVTFHLAVDKGKLKIIKAMVKEYGYPFKLKGIGYQTPDSRKSWKALHSAALHGNVEVARFFLEKGVDINAQISTGSTALHLAGMHGHSDFAKFLITHGASLIIKNQEGKRADQVLIVDNKNNQKNAVKAIVGEFYEAVEKGNRDLVLSDLYYKNKEWLSFPLTANEDNALHVAAKKGHLELINTFIAHSPQLILSTNKSKETPLHVAIKEGKIKVVKSLLEASKQCDLALPTELCNFAEKHSFKSHPQICAIVLDNYPSYSDASLKLKFVQALKNPDKKEVNYYISKNEGWLTSSLENGKNAFHLAAEYNHLELLELMLTKNPNLLNSKTSSGNTALHIAAMHNRTAAVKWLLLKKAEITIQPEQRETPLSLAIKNKAHEVIPTLIKNKVPVSTNPIAENQLQEAMKISSITIQTIVEFIKNGATLQGQNIETSIFKKVSNVNELILLIKNINTPSILEKLCNDSSIKTLVHNQSKVFSTQLSLLNPTEFSQQIPYLVKLWTDSQHFLSSLFHPYDDKLFYQRYPNLCLNAGPVYQPTIENKKQNSASPSSHAKIIKQINTPEVSSHNNTPLPQEQEKAQQHATNNPLGKITEKDELQKETKRSTGMPANFHENSSTVSTKPVASSVVELPKLNITVNSDATLISSYENFPQDSNLFFPQIPNENPREQEKDHQKTAGKYAVTL